MDFGMKQTKAININTNAGFNYFAQRFDKVTAEIGNLSTAVATLNDKADNQHRLSTGQAIIVPGLSSRQVQEANRQAVVIVQGQTRAITAFRKGEADDTPAMAAKLEELRDSTVSSTAQTASSSDQAPQPQAKAKAKAKAKASAMPDLSAIVLQPEDYNRATVEHPEHGPAWDKATKEQQEAIVAHWKLDSLPPDLLEPLMTFLNEAVKHAIVLKGGQYNNDISSRPKLSFAIPRKDGALGLYWWRQAVEDYGRVEPMPPVLEDVVKFYNDLYKNTWNHLMITVHQDGNCGIPPHQDKSHSRSSKGVVESVMPLLDLSLGATRDFVVLHEGIKGNENDLEPHTICTFRMVHNSSVVMPGYINAQCYHAVPLQPLALPRVSVLLRRVDKKFIHPTEARVCHGVGKWEDLVKGKTKTPVEVRRQNLATIMPEYFVTQDLQ